MSAYYHMDLESFALAPKKGIEESLIQILLFAISYSYHAYLIFDHFWASPHYLVMYKGYKKVHEYVTK